MVYVANVIKPRIIAEIGDIRKYYNRSVLIAYSGVDSPRYFESGNCVGTKQRISKRGSPIISIFFKIYFVLLLLLF